MQRNGTSLVEILVCASITVMLTAIITPAFIQAKKEAKISSAANNLKQIGFATLIYQADWESGTRYGNLSEMGLPPHYLIVSTRLGLEPSIYRSPCGLSKTWAPRGAEIHQQYWPDDEGAFSSYSVQLGESTLLWSDINCDDSGVDLWNPYRTHKGLGFLLGGQIVRRTRIGDINRMDWWSSTTGDIQ